MKKNKLSLICACVLSCSILFSSCIGSFSLSNRLLSWNNEISDNKFVNELVFFAFYIIPVYEISYLADILVINSIEFWSGNNPLANVGEVKKVKGENGDFLVETLENGYSISKEGETPVELIYNQETNTWNVVAENYNKELIQFNEDGTAQIFTSEGTSLNVSIDAEGVMAARQYVMNQIYFAAR
ncbi:DUF3332 domain-containing protein [Bacteroides sp. 519]|uniref:DUF3332 domain-containing protein n=1 Tax=Bacteroides sp. 519 TaxID=2302937 RepID=UPI0013D37B74|nr:DUF3332 domain-containing protein [Bacteroides sp. 519]NDV58570.1 DUF3332 domain-containing protein [Bacteroides sp. 519]